MANFFSFWGWNKPKPRKLRRVVSGPINVKIRWTRLGPRSPRWHEGRCLYAYLHPQTRKFFYIGETYHMTPRDRLRGKHKEKIWNRIENKYGGIKLKVVQGELLQEKGRRRREELFKDVESLLIKKLHPEFNERSKRSRKCRPGLTVECLGVSWPSRKRYFKDTPIRKRHTTG